MRRRVGLVGLAMGLSISAIAVTAPVVVHATPVSGQATSHTCEGISSCRVWEDTVTLNYTYDVGVPYVRENWLDCHVDHQYFGYTITERWCGVWNDGGHIPNSAGRYPYMNGGDDFDLCYAAVNCKHYWQRVNVDIYGHVWRTGNAGQGS